MKWNIFHFSLDPLPLSEVKFRPTFGFLLFLKKWNSDHEIAYPLPPPSEKYFTSLASGYFWDGPLRDSHVICLDQMICWLILQNPGVGVGGSGIGADKICVYSGNMSNRTHMRVMVGWVEITDSNNVWTHGVIMTWDTCHYVISQHCHPHNDVRASPGSIPYQGLAYLWFGLVVVVLSFRLFILIDFGTNWTGFLSRSVWFGVCQILLCKHEDQEWDGMTGW